METSKYRIFQFLDAEILPDNKLVVIALSDAFSLGVLSSRFHTTYALRAGSWLGVGNDPVYAKSRCFDPFPFPVCDAKQRAHIAKLAESLDAHRKRAQEQPALGLTTIYNVLEKLRAAQPLTAKEKLVHDHALVSTLRLLHDDLDTAVAAAYNLPPNLTDAEILARLVALNTTRAAEEARGQIRWLRPEFQQPATGSQGDLKLERTRKKVAHARAVLKWPRGKRPKEKWPKERPDPVGVIADALHAAGHPMTAADLAALFARAPKETIAEILSALVIVGLAHRGDKRGTFTP